MVKRVYVLLVIGLAVAPLGLALDNSSTVKDNTAAGLTDHPIWHSKIFARGDIANFCKAYATPSDTQVRAAIVDWQCNEVSRWPDQSAARTITAAREGAPTWSSGVGGIDTIVVAVASGVPIATITFNTSISGLIAVGDRLVVCGAGGTQAAPSTYVYGTYCRGGVEGGMDNVTVTEVDPDNLHVKYISRGVTSIGGSAVTTATFSSNIEVAQKIDPYEPSSVCRFTSANHGFYTGDPVTIAGVNGLTGANGTFTITGVTRNEFVVNSTCSGTYTANGGDTATGTSVGAGSLRQAFVAYVTSVPAGGSTKIDWVNSADPSSAGNAAATIAAGFSEAEMLAYEVNGGDWNFVLDSTAPIFAGSTATISRNARTILTAGNFAVPSYCGNRINYIGPVMTWATVEFGCTGALTYDFGWKISTGTSFAKAVQAADTQVHLTSGTNVQLGTILSVLAESGTSPAGTETMTVVAPGVVAAPTTCDGVAIVSGVCANVARATPSGTARDFSINRTVGFRQYEDAPSDAYKSLHPVYTLKFVNGWNGVGGRIEIKNDWIWKNQTMYYAIDYKTGDTPASRIAKSTFKHVNSSSWMLSVWDGDNPEFFCKGGAGTDPENCLATGGGTRARRYLIDHNTPYLFYSKALPDYKLFAGKATALDASATGFKASDKGAITSTTLGFGTYGAEEGNTSGSGGVKGGPSAQETWPLNDVQAMCLQNWSEACYEINFGDSNPGNAGNPEGEMHGPIFYREDDDTSTRPRFVMHGFGAAMDRAHNRSLSLVARPTWIAYPNSSNDAVGLDVDRRRTACDASAPVTPPTESSSGTFDASGTRGWPCYYVKTAGNDGWDVSSSTLSHQSNSEELLWMMTADPRYLYAIQNRAGWHNGWEYAAGGRGIGKSWASPESNAVSYLPRSYGSWTKALTVAAMWTPNLAQFGYTVPLVDTFRYNEYLWEAGFSKEGAWGITDGNFAQMHPHIDLSAACPATTMGNSVNVWLYAKCTASNGWANPLGWMGIGATTCESWIECATYGNAGFWYTHTTRLTWARAAGVGLRMFDYDRRKDAKLTLSLFGSANWNRYLNGFYQHPTRKGSGFTQTLTDFYLGFKAAGWASGAQNRDQQRWCLSDVQCSIGNEAYATKLLAISALKYLEPTVVGDLDGCSARPTTPAGCTWKQAWNFLNSTLPNQNTWTSMVKYINAPPALIPDLTCSPGATSVTCRYTAPTQDACTYRVADTAPTDSLDSGDSSDGGGGQSRKFAVVGLTEATLHYVRVTCGPRIANLAAGTGRTTTTFTTLAAEGTATTIALKAKAPPGATTATVDYGTTSAVSGGTLGPTTCNVSGCSFNVPGNHRALVYYKITYKTGGGATVAQGSPQSALIP